MKTPCIWGGIPQSLPVPGMGDGSLLLLSEHFNTEQSSRYTHVPNSLGIYLSNRV